MSEKRLPLQFSGPTLPELNQTWVEQLKTIANAFFTITSELDGIGYYRLSPMPPVRFPRRDTLH